MSDPGNDPWEEHICNTLEEAEAWISDFLQRIEDEGFDPAEWIQLIWIDELVSAAPGEDWDPED